MIGLGIIFLVMGAILTFAVSADIEGVSRVMIGYILIGAGGIALLVGLVQQATGGRRIRTTRRLDDGESVTEEKRID